VPIGTMRFLALRGIAVFATGFFAWRVPETKDRTLEQIEADLRADVEDGRRQPTGRFQREKGRVAAR
jgi:hypothetical protein